jgi:hypothetical protein
MKVFSSIIVAAMLLTLPISSVMALPKQTTVSRSLQAYAGYPTFAINSVEKGSSVTIIGYNFPPNDTFKVRMNWMHTLGIAGAVVETVTTDSSGDLSDSTYDIPDFLQNSYQIAIRLESPYSGYYAYNWFYNNTSTFTTSSSSGYTGYPTFAISAVQRNDSVTIWPDNFPPNDTFKVRMNWMHTQGIAGSVVQTVTTDSDGELSDTTYDIPDFLKGSYQIAIRLESPDSGYYAYNWFYNNDAP